jgi:large subunit ribosomal protein L9
MKVILRDNVAKVGKKFEIVNVSDGYALNFLIPKKLAEVATPESERRIEAARARSEAEMAEAESESASLIGELNGQRAVLKRPANEQGHLFSKIHEDDVAEAIESSLGKKVSTNLIAIDNPIKEVGEYEVSLESGSAKGSITIVVERE